MRYWNVYVTVVESYSGRDVKRNKTLGVAAESLDDAVAIVRAAHPDAEFWTVQHRGEINHGIFDNRLMGHHSHNAPHQNEGNLG